MAPTSFGFDRASLIGASLNSGTGDVGPAGTNITGHIFGAGGQLNLRHAFFGIAASADS